MNYNIFFSTLCGCIVIFLTNIKSRGLHFRLPRLLIENFIAFPRERHSHISLPVHL